mgnify:CR=1 FL=1
MTELNIPLLDTLHFIYPLISLWAFWYLHFLTIMNTAVQDFVCTRFMYKILCKHNVSFLWDEGPGVQLLDQIIGAQLDF